MMKDKLVLLRQRSSGSLPVAPISKEAKLVFSLAIGLWCTAGMMGH